MSFRIRFYKDLNSTNSAVLAAAAEGEADGLVIVADRQTAGRGRQGRPWSSPPGVGLYVSVLIRPSGESGSVTLLPLLSGVAAVEAIKTVTEYRAGLKWPNDVLLNGHKIAGILTEAEFCAGESHKPESMAVAVGMGVNVNSSLEDLPERLLYPASSLMLQTGRKTNRQVLLQVWLERMQRWLADWREGRVAELVRHWAQWNALKDKVVRISCADDSELEGIGNAVDEEGALLLHKADGELTRVVAGDVRSARHLSSGGQY